MKFNFRFLAAILLLSIIGSTNSKDLIFAQKIPLTTKVIERYELIDYDRNFLEDLEHRAFVFFWEHSNSETGLTRDRARTNGEAINDIASIAATGFALTAYCIGADRNWEIPQQGKVTRQQAKERTRKTLDFFANRAFHKNGWFYHWMDQKTGERVWNSEIASIDTALLLGGVLTVRKCFVEDKEIVDLATKIYERVDFEWMLAGHESLLSHGWKPETGFLKSRWTDYGEHSILYLLAIGSPTHPIPWESWYKWQRNFYTYESCEDTFHYLTGRSYLFIHQFSQAWFDLRGKRERYKNFGTDYFQNSVIATYAQRQYFVEELSEEFSLYSENIWGLTASDSQKSYAAWGAPLRHPKIDGTVVPCAAAGSLMFTPEISLSALIEMKAIFGNMKDRFDNQMYGRYGFADAFNPHNGWVNPDVIGIDVGITLLSAENLQTGNVWKWFMQNEEATNALEKVKMREDE